MSVWFASTSTCPRSFARSCLSESSSWARSTARFWPEESICARRASIAERRSSIDFWRLSTWFLSWTICRRASSSSNRAAWARSGRRNAPRKGGRGGFPHGRFCSRPARSVLAAVEHVAAAVLRPAPFVMVGAARLLLAEADRFDLRIGRAHQHERALHALGAALPERDVVFAAAALVAVALNEHFRAAVLGEILAVGLQDRPVLVLDVRLVVVVEDRTLRRDAARRGSLDGARRDRRTRRGRGDAGLFGFGGLARASVQQCQGQGREQSFLHGDLLECMTKREDPSPRAPLNCGRSGHPVTAS